MSSGMFDEGFLFDELSQAKRDILRSISKAYPKESDKFLKDEAKKLLKVTKKVAKKEVGTSKGKKKDWEASKSYHRKFKVGKKYKYDTDDCIRVYNSAPHAHLIEYGHRQIARGLKRATTREDRKNDSRPVGGFVLGKYVFDFAQLEFTEPFKDDCEAFMYQFVDDTVKGKY